MKFLTSLRNICFIEELLRGNFCCIFMLRFFNDFIENVWDLVVVETNEDLLQKIVTQFVFFFCFFLFISLYTPE